MMDGQVDQAAKRYLDRVSHNAIHLLTLINNLLDLSYIEAGRLTLHQEQVDLKEFLTHVAARVPALLQGKPLRFTYAVDPTLGVIYTDPFRLDEILDSLLDNAVKFTPQGEIRLAARCQCHVREGCKPPVIEIAVSDTGIGIPRESQEIIFDEFRQVDASVTRRYEGLGLGLVLCKKLVGLLGGSIKVESEVGKGSTFRMVLPLEENF